MSQADSHKQKLIDAARGRYDRVFRLRSEKKTYREIGEILGVSPTRARYLYLRASEINANDEQNRNPLG